MKNRILIIVILMSFACSAVTVVADDTGDSVPVIQLPTDYVTMLAKDGTTSWFNMDLSDVPEGYDVTDGQYHGWCVQKDVTMTRGVEHTVVLYSSYNPNMPQAFSNENWDKINYLINHEQGSRETVEKAIWYYFHCDAFPSDSTAQAMIADADANGSGFVPQPGERIAILVDGVPSIQRTFFELICPEPHSGNGGSTGRNHAPTADATAGQPYNGFVGEEIIFNGSRSYDRDGSIVSYQWDFGDGSTGSGVVASRIYSLPGTYTVRLTVTDDDGATNTHAVTAKIIWANYPPNTPVIEGPESGHKNTSYNYTAISTDVENDSLQYTFTWGDGQTNITEFFPNGIIPVRTHSWAAAGRYVISVKAFDNRTESEAATLAVLIDAVYVGDFGYLIDKNGDGIYDSFYSNMTGTETQVGNANGNYLIDTDGDGTWDYEYNPFTNEIKELSEGASSEGILNGYTLGVIGILLVVIILLVIFFVVKNKKENTSGKSNGRL